MSGRTRTDLAISNRRLQDENVRLRATLLDVRGHTCGICDKCKALITKTCAKGSDGPAVPSETDDYTIKLKPMLDAIGADIVADIVAEAGQMPSAASVPGLNDTSVPCPKCGDDYEGRTPCAPIVGPLRLGDTVRVMASPSIDDEDVGKQGTVVQVGEGAVMVEYREHIWYASGSLSCIKRGSPSSSPAPVPTSDDAWATLIYLQAFPGASRVPTQFRNAVADALLARRRETIEACKDRLRAKANETAQIGGEDGPTGALWLDRAANSLSISSLSSGPDGAKR